MIEPINLSSYTNKGVNDSVTNREWNDVFTLTQNKINEIITGTPDVMDDFYVNDERVTPVQGVVTLQAEGKYKLHGTLNGKVVIISTATPVDDTYIILDGVTIVSSDTDNKAISYSAESQSMQVTLVKNKMNTLVCSHVAEMAEQQGASLYSENNMILQGNGYLQVINKGGHGIKASELKIHGRPHVYCEAIHDGIHGNSKLNITDGYFCINGANDACGTGSTGKINLFGGHFFAYNIKQKVFDSKVEGLVYGDIYIDTDKNEADVFENIRKFSSADFGEGLVTSDGVTPIEKDESGVYIVTSAWVQVSGYIDGTIELTQKTTDVVLNGAYINCEGDGIYYSQGSKKVQISCNKDTVNIINVTGGNGIKSNNNATVECKGGSYLSVSSADDIGIYASEFTFHDSKGVLIVKGCGKYGIQGTDIYLASSADNYSPDKKDPTKEPVGGALLCYNNGGADIHARLSSSGLKGWVTSEDEYLQGIIFVENLSVSSSAKLGGAENFYYSNAKGIITGSKGKTEEPYDYIPYGKNYIL